MNLLRHIYEKRESFSAHAAWGALLGLTISHRLENRLCAVPVAAFAGLLWEIIGDLVTAGKWRPRALDILPWMLGGCLAIFIEAVIL